MNYWVVTIGPLSFHADTALYSLGVTIFLLVFAFIATRRMTLVPGRLQSLVEMIVEFLENMVRDNAGQKSLIYLPFFATLMIYIFVANMVGLIPGLRSPTADVNITLALAVSVMVAVQFASIKANGARNWLLSFIRPNPVFFFIHLLELVARPLTLALRLFGNIFAGEVMIVILYMLMPAVVPVLWLAFSLGIGIIQAYIFSVLSVAYTGLAVEE